MGRTLKLGIFVRWRGGELKKRSIWCEYMREGSGISFVKRGIYEAPSLQSSFSQHSGDLGDVVFVPCALAVRRGLV